MTALHAPHRRIRCRDDRERFLVRLLDALWDRYRARVSYVRAYEDLLARRGAAFVNDHVAFRAIAWDRPAGGIFSISRIFEALGYTPRGCYEFPDKHLGSLHFQHPHPDLPRVFITQLKAWELSAGARRVLGKYLASARPGPADADLAALHGLSGAGGDRLFKSVLAHFQRLPWDRPQKRDVLALDRESQFAAWTLLNGYEVNHFTAAVHSQGPALDDIEKTVAAMREAGIPMKREIEGERGTKLRQSATEAVVVPTPAREGKKDVLIPWTYAYFEIAERPWMEDPATGRKERFDGFLGGQATNLFEMTRLKK